MDIMSERISKVDDYGRNITLDYFKLLLSVLVICIHIGNLFTSQSILGFLIENGIARIAVPCFFIINGYFISSILGNSSNIYKYIKRIFILYIVWGMIYFSSVFKGSPSDTFINLLMGHSHLWYLVSLIEGTILLYFLLKIIKRKTLLLFLSFLLLCIGVYLQYYFSVLNKIHFYRNAIFIGLPFLYLGYYIRSIESQIFQVNRQKLIILTVLSLIGLLLESFFAYKNIPVGRGFDLYISLFFLCPLLFVVVLRFSKFVLDRNSYISDLSAGIYFIHPLAVVISGGIFPINNIYYLSSIIFVSLIMSAGTIELNKRIKIFL